MNWSDYQAGWSALHGGYVPSSPVVRGWIRIAWRAGVLLGKLGVGPTTVTLVGLVLCVLVPVAALFGPTFAQGLFQQSLEREPGRRLAEEGIPLRPTPGRR